MNDYEEITSVFSESVSVSGEGYTIPDNTELVDTVSVTSGSALVTVDYDVVSDIYVDVHIIMVLAILSFAMSCMRGWRKNTLKGC